MILDLQQALEATKAQLSSSQAELKASQRQVVRLAKENEDLKERRERARLESEGLNGVVARKERLLQEVSHASLASRPHNYACDCSED